MMMSFQDFLREAKEVRLSSGERAAIKSALMETMHGPLNHQSFFSRFLAFYSPKVVTVTLVVTAGFAATGIGYAAENSLPGDMLYPVKINFNEPLRGTLAFSKTSSAEWKASQAERRLTELERLLAMNKIDPETSGKLSSEFAKEFSELKQDIHSFLGDSQIAYAHDLNLSFQSSLKAHLKIIGSAKKSFSGSESLLAMMSSANNALEENHATMELKAPGLYSADTQKTELERVLAQGNESMGRFENRRLSINSKALTAETLAIIDRELTCAEEAFSQARKSTDTERALHLAYAGVTDLKEAELAFENKTFLASETSEIKDIAAEVENERHDGTELSATVQLRLTRDRLSYIKLAFQSSPASGNQPIIAKVQEINKLVESATDDLKDGKCDSALKSSRLALAKAEILRNNL